MLFLSTKMMRGGSRVEWCRIKKTAWLSTYCKFLIATSFTGIKWRQLKTLLYWVYRLMFVLILCVGGNTFLRCRQAVCPGEYTEKSVWPGTLLTLKSGFFESFCVAVSTCLWLERRELKSSGERGKVRGDGVCWVFLGVWKAHNASLCVRGWQAGDVMDGRNQSPLSLKRRDMIGTKRMSLTLFYWIRLWWGPSSSNRKHNLPIIQLC